jgi:phospholipid/cholesterol/gamma-HCH transport system permease protein
VLRRVVEATGSFVIDGVESVGAMILLAVEVIVWLLRPPWRIRLFLQSMDSVGVGSLFIIGLTGTFTGAVFALQSAYAFRLFNAESLVGSTVALSLTRELSPVLTALLVTGRSGSGVATELGTMRVTEQIDALASMAVNPTQYLIVPRVVAFIVMMPILCTVFTMVGMVGAWVVGVQILGIDPGQFLENVRWYVDPRDVFVGLIKATVFGALIGLIACRKGFYASGGAKGVGEATTGAVVTGSVTVLISDYLLTWLMY